MAFLLMIFFILMFGVVAVAWLGYKLFKKRIGSFSLSFVFAFVLMSVGLHWVEYQEPPSEYFGIPYFALPYMLSLPSGLVADQLFKNDYINYHVRDYLTIILGAIQWGIILFTYENLKSKGKI